MCGAAVAGRGSEPWRQELSSLEAADAMCAAAAADRLAWDSTRDMAALTERALRSPRYVLSCRQAWARSQQHSTAKTQITLWCVQEQPENMATSTSIY